MRKLCPLTTWESFQVSWTPKINRTHIFVPTSIFWTRSELDSDQVQRVFLRPAEAAHDHPYLYQPLPTSKCPLWAKNTTNYFYTLIRHSESRGNLRGGMPYQDIKVSLPVFVENWKVFFALDGHSVAHRSCERSHAASVGIRKSSRLNCSPALTGFKGPRWVPPPQVWNP